ncbi:MAG: lysozyme [Plesiomonas sp.]|uniref:lysozyme n=1 Tax=Plesiomonas sp. TaxID=2486279 RepID=UPI003F37A9D4
MSIRKAVVGAVCSVSIIAGLVVELYPNEVRTSQEGLLLIGNAEGCRRDPYLCPANRLTVGLGSTHNVQREKRYSDAEIAQLWVYDIKDAEDCVNRYFNGKNMPQRPFEAMTSLVFNVGCYGVRWNRKAARPTGIYQQAQAGNWAAMCNRIPDFENSGGKPILRSRRIKETAWCLQE